MGEYFSTRATWDSSAALRHLVDVLRSERVTFRVLGDSHEELRGVQLRFFLPFLSDYSFGDVVVRSADGGRHVTYSGVDLHHLTFGEFTLPNRHHTASSTILDLVAAAIRDEERLMMDVARNQFGNPRGGSWSARSSGPWVVVAYLPTSPPDVLGEGPPDLLVPCSRVYSLDEVRAASRAER